MADEINKDQEEDQEDETETMEEVVKRLEEEVKNLKSEKESIKDLRKVANKAKEGEQSLEGRLEVIETERQKELESRRAAVEGVKGKVLDRRVGDDADDRAKVEREFSLLNMPSNTPEEAELKWEKAVSMVPDSSRINPMNLGTPMAPEPDIVTARDKQFIDTADGKMLAKQLGMTSLLAKAK